MAAPDIHSLFIEGQKKLLAAGNEAEKTKVGTLRAGNTGLLTANMQIIGPCMALTYLRHKGIDVKGLEDDGDSGGAAGRELMFEAGRVNEDLWTAVLEQSWPGSILREEQIATTWETTKGVKVTGRPDIVLCQSIASNGKTQIQPIIGLELKQVSSFWTAYEVKFKGQPKYNHLLQAAHYSWQLGIPFELWYTSRTDYHAVDWIKRELPQPGQLDSEYVTYSYFRVNQDNKSGKSKVSKLEWEALPVSKRMPAEALKVTPFIQGYKIELRAGKLFYASATASNPVWFRTDITVDDIKRYYEMVTELKEVPPEPIIMKADGQKAGYKARDYCSLGAQCCAYQAGRPLDEWVEDIKRQVQSSK